MIKTDRIYKKITAFVLAVIVACSSFSLSAFASIETVNSNYFGNYDNTSNPDWSWITISPTQINLQAVYCSKGYVCVVSTNGYVTSESFSVRASSYLECDSMGGNRVLKKGWFVTQGDVSVSLGFFGINYIDVALRDEPSIVYRKD